MVANLTVMSVLLERCVGLPTREYAAGEVVMVEGERSGVMLVVAEGTFEVTRQGSVVTSITDRGAVLGEISVLLQTGHGATVTATSPAVVHVIDDPLGFVSADAEGALEIARILARRLDRLVGYLADVKAQYSESGGHLDLLDAVLSELTFGEQAPVEPGSERDPEPYY